MARTPPPTTAVSGSPETGQAASYPLVGGLGADEK